MTAIKRSAMVMALILIAAMIIVVARSDRIPPLPIPDLLERNWGRTEPLKQHTQQRAREIDVELDRDAS